MVTLGRTPPQTDNLPDPALAEAAVELAARLLQRAQAEQRPSERAQMAKIGGMMDDPDGKTLTMQMSDQAFRSHRPARIADQIHYLLGEYGVPQYMQAWERAALDLGDRVAQFLPGLVVPFIVAKLRQETSNVLLPGEPSAFQRYLKRRYESGTRLNINHLGEAVLGEGEAGRRLEAYLGLLARPDVEYISVKISSVFSQIHLTAFEETVEQIEDRLRTLYRAAMAHEFVTADGRRVPKFVNLDMEEYRDLHLTVTAFKAVLGEPEFAGLRAGIVLQAYLPDSFAVQQDLTVWAQARVANGGAPIKLRIVKGANLAMEQVEASLHGWPQAPYTSKPQVDANYKRMVTYGTTPERARAVQLGVASHNLFDLSYALLLRERHGLHDEIEFEMLEGMANHQARAVQAEADGLLLYAPVVKRDDFHSAIAYLVRRLDENTAPQNFLHDLFGMEVGDARWEKQRALFLEAFAGMDAARATPNRTQNRQTEAVTFDAVAPFHNEPDTDFSLPWNQAWLREVYAAWAGRSFEPIPLQIAGEFIHTEQIASGTDPAQPDDTAYTYVLASAEQLETALETAEAGQTAWAAHSVAERKQILVRAASLFAQRRGDLLGVMMRDGGKTAGQADPEISEAIDFANYYARSFDEMPRDAAFEPLGTVLVTPPWNFPLAIPAGGVLAALMAGNTVLFKPAPEATLTGWHIAQVLWDAGVPHAALQFVPTTDDAVGRGLVTDSRVDAVILTGAYETARMFLGWKPGLRLFAETSGKNALIVTGMADRDAAIKDLVASAFGHAGQKCSAASLGILEAEVYDDETFRRQLVDAARSQHVGPATDPRSVIGPVIRQPDEKLHRALTTLEPGESWLLEPRNLGGNIWTPGIKLGVAPGSFFHKTEVFGPVLGLMRADNLDHAIDLANAVDYGLTGGVHSLDDREVDRYLARVQVGNAYTNRSITGAIVRRQPFGGWKQSAFGTAKAGGPNYTWGLGTWRDTTTAPLVERARASYAVAWDTHFSIEHDPSDLLGESNRFRYRRLGRVVAYSTADTDPADLERVQMAAEICGVPLTLVQDDEAALCAAMEDPAYRYDQRVRLLGDISEETRRAAHEAHVLLVDAPVVSEGRLELRHYLKEQALSVTTHRYGNIVR